jgi:hypothetical protein
MVTRYGMSRRSLRRPIARARLSRRCAPATVAVWRAVASDHGARASVTLAGFNTVSGQEQSAAGVISTRTSLSSGSKPSAVTCSEYCAGESNPPRVVQVAPPASDVQVNVTELLPDKLAWTPVIGPPSGARTFSSSADTGHSGSTHAWLPQPLRATSTTASPTPNRSRACVAPRKRSKRIVIPAFSNERAARRAGAGARFSRPLGAWQPARHSWHNSARQRDLTVPVTVGRHRMRARRFAARAPPPPRWATRLGWPPPHRSLGASLPPTAVRHGGVVK